MHPDEPKNAFLLLRANGWSFRSIAQQLGVPKSTLFNWESETATRRAINVIKSIQLERLQEQYIPSFEEELQKLATCLARVETALEKQDFDAMRPEFLLRTSLQLRSRLNNLRSDIQPSRTLHEDEPPIALPGCISRSQNIADGDGDSPPSPLNRRECGRDSLSPTGGEGQGEGAVHTTNAAKWDKTKNFSEPEPSAPATSNPENGTPVPNSGPQSVPTPAESPFEALEPITPNHAHERYGNLDIPLVKIPANADELSLTANFGLVPRLTGDSPSPLNGLRANASAKDNSISAGVRGEAVALVPS